MRMCDGITMRIAMASWDLEVRTKEFLRKCVGYWEILARRVVFSGPCRNYEMCRGVGFQGASYCIELRSLNSSVPWTGSQSTKHMHLLKKSQYSGKRALFP